jgi:hypothetical protein
MLHRFGKVRPVLFLALTLCAVSCSGKDEGANVHYEVRLRDGGAVALSIRYSLPSGEERTAEGTTPWTTPSWAFDANTTLSLHAETTDGVESPSLCNLVGMGDEGSWTHRTSGEPLDKCVTVYRLGPWPPNDNTGSLIRVG